MEIGLVYRFKLKQVLEFLETVALPIKCFGHVLGIGGLEEKGV